MEIEKTQGELSKEEIIPQIRELDTEYISGVNSTHLDAVRKQLEGLGCDPDGWELYVVYHKEGEDDAEFSEEEVRADKGTGQKIEIRKKEN